MPETLIQAVFLFLNPLGYLSGQNVSTENIWQLSKIHSKKWDRNAKQQKGYYITKPHSIRFNCSPEGLAPTFSGVHNIAQNIHNIAQNIQKSRCPHPIFAPPINFFIICWCYFKIVYFSLNFNQNNSKLLARNTYQCCNSN